MPWGRSGAYVSSPQISDGSWVGSWFRLRVWLGAAAFAIGGSVVMGVCLEVPAVAGAGKRRNAVSYTA
jgi:hypothetical protein